MLAYIFKKIFFKRSHTVNIAEYLPKIHRKTWNIIPYWQNDRHFSQTTFNDANQRFQLDYFKLYFSVFSFHVVQGSSCKKYFKIKIFLRNRISKNCSWKIAILELIKRMKNVSTLLSKSLFVYCRYQLISDISLLLYYPNFNGKYEGQIRMIKSLRITINCKRQILATEFT